MNCLEKYRRKLIADINRNLGVVTQSPEEDSVHDYRVGIKRLTALYHLLDEINPALNAKRLLKPYRAAFKLIGDIRDVHIAINLLESLEGTNARDIKILIRALRAKAARDYRRFQRYAGGEKRPAIRMPSIHSSGISERSMLRYKPEVLNRLLMPILDTGQKTSAKQWHKKRILLKRYHHILDAFCYCPGHGLDESELKQMKILEQLLGDWHDRVVTTELLLNLAQTEGYRDQAIAIMQTQDKLLLGAAKIYLAKYARWHGRE